jgi:peroxiredoxin Q/BCP
VTPRRTAASKACCANFFIKLQFQHILGWMLAWFSPLLPTGSAAPDFTLPDEHGNQITLSKLGGRNVVLVFYPGDNTRVCTRQLCAFRDHAPLASSVGTLVFGVNPQGAASHRKFREKHKLPFPLLVDRGGKVASLYHAGGWIVRRSVYVVGREGIIRFAKRGTPDAKEVLAAAV